MTLRLPLLLAPALAACLAAPLAAAPAAPERAPGFGAVAAPPWLALPADEEAERRGRSRPRVPGGSGCDDPRDILEHPACRR